MEEFVSRSIANFGAKLFNEANSMEPTVCSPLSVEMVMAMLALGCKEKSNAEILRTLGIPDDDVLLASFAYIKSTLKSIRGATLNVANKIYIKNCAELKPGVKKDYEEIFESSIEHIDFSVQGAAANAIKNWFREQTNSNTSLGAVLDDNTRLVLVNAIYFQGVWEKPFDTRLYTYSLFHTSRNTTTEVFLMKIPKTWFKYGVSLELNARLLQLNFEGGEASMVIVLPDEAVGLDAMIQKLDSGHNIMADIETLRNTELEVMMPRFDEQTTSHLNLVSLLLKLGIRSIFDERKSEVNMFRTNNDLYGSKAGQAILIQVDDRESTRTADCSADSSMSTMEDISTDHGVERFVANRPFLYMIIVRGLPIFMGSYTGGSEHILNYSCNHLNRIFSLSVSTFYSRYDNIEEQQMLNRILDFEMRNLVDCARIDNDRNRAIEEGKPNFGNPEEYRSPLRRRYM
ncbi:alaserpin-like [Choristoneura fumiferana]|uniref:alaserpin-like n=1 Tax=Choristoneura fumiferana TaxID=7141 RepID=UPI003D158561